MRIRNCPLLFAAFLLAIVSCGEQSSAQMPGLKFESQGPKVAVIAKGRNAPDFTATDLSGRKISLKQFRGKVVLLDFWATWCTPCHREIPHLKSLHEKYKNKDFIIIGVSLDLDISILKSFVREKKLKWIQIWDGVGGDICRRYRIVFIPTAFLIGRDGSVVERDLRGKELEAALKGLLKE